eukprot:7577091-Pyramimonas_sp.AAC.1
MPVERLVQVLRGARGERVVRARLWAAVVGLRLGRRRKRRALAGADGGGRALGAPLSRTGGT